MTSRYPGVDRLEDGRVLIRWTVRLGGRNGKSVNRKLTLPASTSLSEAARIRATKAEATVREVKQGTTDKRSELRTMTLGAFAAQWLEQRGASFKAATTLENWADVLVHHILPVLGHLEIGKIRRHDVAEWVAVVERKTFIPHTARPKKVKQPDGSVIIVEPVARPYAKDTVSSWWTKLRQILKDAAADAETTDPTLRVQPPMAKGRKKIRERRTLSAEELRSLFDAIPAGWHAEIVATALTGWRPGEVYALEWNRDMHLERQQIELTVAHARGVLGTPKTEERTGALGEFLVEVFRAHRRKMIRDEHPGLASGLVFPASERSSKVDPSSPNYDPKMVSGRPADGWYRMPGSMLKVLARAAASIDLPIRVTPQVLRRTWNSLQVESGVDRLVMRSIIGHVDEEMTELYTHVRHDQKLAVQRNLEGKVLSLTLSQPGTAPAPEMKKPRSSEA